MVTWGLIVYALAIVRVVGLIAYDAITEYPRNLFVSWLPSGRIGEWLDDLITCPWCVSIWVAAAASPLIYWYGARPWMLIPALALAASQITGMLAQVGRRSSQ